MDNKKQMTKTKFGKVLALTLALMLVLFGLSACGKKSADNTADSDEYGEYEWPRSEIAKLLPQPKSTTGKLNWDNSTGFNIDIAKTTKGQYKDYVNACCDNDFTVDYSKGDDYYRAKDQNGYNLSLNYDDEENVMTISISAPNDDEDNNDSKNTDLGDLEIEDETTTEKTTKKVKKTKSKSSVNWKEFLKEYEDWVDDYIELVKKYEKNPNDTSLLTEYTEQMGKIASWSEKADKVKVDLANNPDDLAEYTKTLSRILNKLSKIQ